MDSLVYFGEPLDQCVCVFFLRGFVFRDWRFGIALLVVCNECLASGFFLGYTDRANARHTTRRADKQRPCVIRRSRSGLDVLKKTVNEKKVAQSKHTHVFKSHKRKYFLTKYPETLH